MSPNGLPQLSVSPEVGGFDIPELDLIYCGFLFFGRPFAPETLTVGETDPVLVASALVTSDRFSREVAEPALDGALKITDNLVPAAFVDWAKAAFNLDGQSTEWRLDLLSQVLQSKVLATNINTGDWPWSANGLAAACRGFPAAPLVVGAEQITKIARGVKDVLVVDAGEHAVAIGNEIVTEVSKVEFTLDSAINEFPFFRLDFGFLPKSENQLGKLQLNYGNGFSNPILLLPQGRARYAAFVSAIDLQTVRWQPDQNSSGGLITMLTARPISQGDVEAQVLTVAAEDGLQWLFDMQEQLLQNANSGELGFEISNRLTMDLGGHAGCVASATREYDYWVQAAAIVPKAHTLPAALTASVVRWARAHWRASSLRLYLARGYHLARRILAGVAA